MLYSSFEVKGFVGGHGTVTIPTIPNVRMASQLPHSKIDHCLGYPNASKQLAMDSTDAEMP